MATKSEDNIGSNNSTIFQKQKLKQVLFKVALSAVLSLQKSGYKAKNILCLKVTKRICFGLHIWFSKSQTFCLNPRTPTTTDYGSKGVISLKIMKKKASKPRQIQNFSHALRQDYFAKDKFAFYHHLWGDQVEWVICREYWFCNTSNYSIKFLSYLIVFSCTKWSISLEP